MTGRGRGRGRNSSKMTITTNKTSKTHALTGADLKQIRLGLGFAPRDMCAVLGLKRRTYQCYEAGQRGIPSNVAAAARQVEERNLAFMAALPGRIAALVSRDYPAGILSEGEY